MVRGYPTSNTLSSSQVNPPHSKFTGRRKLGDLSQNLDFLIFPSSSSLRDAATSGTEFSLWSFPPIPSAAAVTAPLAFILCISCNYSPCI